MYYVAIKPSSNPHGFSVFVRRPDGMPEDAEALLMFQDLDAACYFADEMHRLCLAHVEGSEAPNGLNPRQVRILKKVLDA